ncbi:MAG: glutathione S-transferase family protein [Oceanococcaceae bacterium]
MSAAQSIAPGPAAPWTLYKMDVSYFSGKLEAYLRYKRIAYTAVETDAAGLDAIHAAVGVKKVPVLVNAAGDWLLDTTPTMAWLEEQYPAHPTLPEDPALRFVALLIEDYADEWLWRPAMWWRWVPRASQLALGRRIADGVQLPGVPRTLVAHYFAWRQRRTWLWNDGLRRADADGVRDLYHQELALMSAVLREQPFLLGDAPSVADYGYFASMYRHFGNDPDPAEIMRREAPEVYSWTARMWHPPAPVPKPQWRWPESTAWQALWQRIGGDYLPYLAANAQAWADNKRRFDFQGCSLRLAGTVTHRYRVWCRHQLLRQFRALSADDQQRVAGLIGDQPGWDDLRSGPLIDPQLDNLYALPKRHGQHRQTLSQRLFGQPRD